MSPQRTDFESMEKFTRRAREFFLHGDVPVGETRKLVVKFDTKFDQFAANVAFQLRFLIVYRTDGGHFARGLVRQTGELQAIHRQWVKDGHPNGRRMSLLAQLWRRKHPNPTMRWMMSVQFGIPVIDDDAEDVSASPQITAQSEKALAELILAHAAVVVENPKWSGDRQKRIRDWIKLAQQTGYPGFLNLWYYNRTAVFEYVNWDTTEGRRKAMTTASGGNLPFDGTTGSMSQGVSFSAPPDTPWREYPFRNMMKKCKGQPSIDNCDGLIGNELRFAESEIFQSIAEMNKQVKRVAPAGGVDFLSVSGSPADNLGPLAGKFLRDISARLHNDKTLYGTFIKYTQQDNSTSQIW